MNGDPRVLPAEKRPLVLVVDDHPSILRFIQTGLEIRGLAVITTTSGEEALRLLELAAPDIVLLDVVMPGTNGLEVLRRLRTYSPLPVIVFSANLETRDEAIRIGASDFVVKPFNTDELVVRIRGLVGG
jgi:two-component system KDP operon response regulator KdpE